MCAGFFFLFILFFFTSKQVFKMESCGKLDYFSLGVISRDGSRQLEIYENESLRGGG